MATKLTKFSKLLIVMVVMVILFFLFQKFLPGFQAENNDKDVKVEQAQEEKSQKEAKVIHKNSNQNDFTKSFNYVPTSPVDGKLKGVVELGASGFNSFIVNMDKNKNWELKKAEWGNSMVYDNMATSEDIRAGLKKYITDILDYGVKGKDIHFVVSSGAQKVESTHKIIKELRNMKYFVNTVTPEQEAKYALKSVLPKRFESSAFVVDIGSGNTKLSWLKNDNSIKGLEAYGAKYYTKNISDEKAYKDVYDKAKMVPSDRSSICFIIGGVPYKFAKQVRKNKERYTVLQHSSFYSGDAAKAKAGKNIYKAIEDATGCKQFVFDWDSNFTIGFLLNL